MDHGTFVVFDGLDGASKTTQVKLFTEALRKRGTPVVPTFEPTNSEVGVLLQNELHKSDKWRMPARALLHLFVADRLLHLKQVIMPALREGVTVVSDRYYFSTMVHQGIELAPDPQDFHRAVNYIEALHRGFRKPDITFFLDVPPEVAFSRLQARGGKPQATEKLPRMVRARRHYQQLATALPDNIYLVDATKPPEQIHEKVMMIFDLQNFHQPPAVL